MADITGKDWKFSWAQLGEDDIYLDPADDPAVQPLAPKKAGYTWDVSRLLQHVPYSGTGSMQELLELEENMRSLIDENKFGYKYLESMLINLGYGLNKIRKVFKKLTGVDPDVYLDNQAFLNTPSSIPQINYGWGEAKDKTYQFYFVMPWVSEYCVFGQKNDTEREIISKHADLQSAYDALTKKVKEIYQYDRPITEKDLVKSDSKGRALAVEDFPFGTKLSGDMNIAACHGFAPVVYTPDDVEKVMRRFVISKSEAEKLLKQKSPEELGISARITTQAAGEKDEKEEKGEKEERPEKQLSKTEFFDITSPDSFMGKNVGDTTPIIEIFTGIMTCIDQFSSKVEGYKISLQGVQYVAQKGATFEQTPEVKGITGEPTTFNAQAVFSVVLSCTREETVKKMLLVFTWDQKNGLVTNGVFKGQTGQLYGLSQEGLDKYFGA